MQFKNFGDKLTTTLKFLNSNVYSRFERLIEPILILIYGFIRKYIIDEKQ